MVRLGKGGQWWQYWDWQQMVIRLIMAIGALILQKSEAEKWPLDMEIYYWILRQKRAQDLLQISRRATSQIKRASQEICVFGLFNQILALFNYFLNPRINLKDQSHRTYTLPMALLNKPVQTRNLIKSAILWHPQQFCSHFIYLKFINMPLHKRVTAITDFQVLAQERVGADSYAYFTSGSDDEITLRNNIKALKDIYLTPRVLVDMTHFSMKTSLLGEEVDLPFGIAPFAMQKLLHPKGELLTASQAFNRNTAYGLSMMTTTKSEQVVTVNPSGLKILQLYFMKNADYTIDVIRLAEKRGFKALAITVDTQIFGKRREDQRNVFRPAVNLQLMTELGFNYKMKDLQNPSKSFIHQLKNNISWEDIKWMKSQTHLKIILKGVISPEDIPMADACGVDAIWISNHGGRQLDTSPATIFALPSIRKKINYIKSKMQVYIDGGIKTGSDIFKCLAMGADYVFVGRGFLFSVAFGQQGVKLAFDMLTNELRTTMMLCGCNSIKSITPEFILKYPKAKL